MADPYDPTKRGSDYLGDASLFQGNYYLYFGPTPALLLMLPWKAVTGAQLPQWLTTAIFASGGLAALAMLLLGIQRRHYPAVSPFQLFFVILLTGHVSWILVVLRRSGVWELPIVAAAVLFWWSLYFLWKYHDSGRRTRWAVAGGVALAFVLGARPTYLFTAGLVAFLFALPLERTRPVSTCLRRLLPVGIPLVIGMAGLLAYNDLRFGSLFDFGQRYQLNAQDWRGVSSFRVFNIPFNLWLYLFSLPQPGPYFPFFHAAWTGTLPSNYTGVEEMQGILFAMPAHLLGAMALIHSYRRRSDTAFGPTRFILIGAGGATLFSGSILFCFMGAGSRYAVELLAGWSALTGVGFLIVFSRQAAIGRSRISRALALAVAVWSIFYVWMASFDYRRAARMANPTVCPAIAEALNYPSYWVANHIGQQFGPLALNIRLPASPASGSTVLLGTGSQGMLNELLIDRMPPDLVRLRLVVNNMIMAETPLLRHTGGTLHVLCHAPWLFPPAAHPFWRAAYPDADERRTHQTLYAMAIDGVVYARQSWWGFDATRFDPFVRTTAGDPASCAWVESYYHIAP